MTTELEYAYIAGFFDGEGAFDMLHRHGRNYGNGYAREYRMYISNCSKELLESIQQTLGNKGTITLHRWKRAWTDGYSLRFNHNTIREILPKLMPYLRLKKPIAELMIQVLDLTANTKRTEERSYQLNKLIDDFRKARLQIKGHKCKAHRKDDDFRKQLLEKHK